MIKHYRIITLTILFFCTHLTLNASAQVLHSMNRSTHPVSKDSLKLVFSTYIGGSQFEQIRDITSDKSGNIYITGGTTSPDFPTTPGVYDNTFAEGGTSLGSGGPMDIFIVKYSSNGKMVWSTFLGGPNYDRAYAIEVDDSGYVFVGGRAGDGFPTTPGVLQPTFAGDISPNGAYGKQDGFIAKLSQDGSRLIWATYFGSNDGGIIRDIDIDSVGYVYLVQPGAANPHPHITQNAFQKTNGGGNDVVVAKISPDASHVVWATYFGGSGDDGGGPSIRVDGKGFVYIAGSSTSTNLPTTQGAYDRAYNGGQNDLFVAKFSPDGSSLIYGTYLGGSGNEGVETHNLAVDREGNSYVSSGTTSSDFPTTPGAFQRTRPGGNGDTFISKISVDGTSLLGSTFIGGNQGDFSQGIYADDDQNIYIGGYTASPNFPVTPNAFQKSFGGVGDIFVLKLASDFSRPLYASYFGGSMGDDGRTLWADEQGNIYVAGQTLSKNLPILNAQQPMYADTTNKDDGCLAKFSPMSSSTGIENQNIFASAINDFFITPNPMKSMAHIYFSLQQSDKVTIKLFDILGREIRILMNDWFEAGKHSCEFNPIGLSSGVYYFVLETKLGVHSIAILVMP